MESQGQINFWLFVYGLLSITGFGFVLYGLWLVRWAIVDLIVIGIKLGFLVLALTVWFFCMWMTYHYWPVFS